MKSCFYFFVFQFFRVLGQDKLGLDCCRSIRISSTSYGRENQPASMGNYYAMDGKLNNRLVYKHSLEDVYVYYWSWGTERGQNWMVGGNFQTSNRGIESDNLEFNFINNSWCVTDINLTQVPFRVLLNSGNWRRDTTLRVECLYNNTGCCRNVQLDSEARVGPVSRYQSDLLGNYTATDLHNGRYLYTRDIGQGYIYYHDWGPNSGTNWMVSRSRNGGSSRSIESHNVEPGYWNKTMCLNEALESGYFQVYNGNTWVVDLTFKIECIENK